MKVLLVDDHTLFVEALRKYLEDQQIAVVGTAADGLEAVERVRELHPDVVLMDVDMPRCGGIEATRRIKAEYPSVKVVMLTASAEDRDLFDAVASGASGYITKDITLQAFLDLLAGLTRGEAAMTRKTAVRLMGALTQTEPPTAPPADPEPELSPRQVEVLRLVAAGYTYKEVAATMSLSQRTVNYHISEVLGKLRLQNRAQAIAYASRHGLLGPYGPNN